MANIQSGLIETERRRSVWALVGVFTLSIFLSATLLFSVQPMFAKLVLPMLGGSSNVWNTAMVFFQTMLLGGYIYAHILSKFLTFRLQILVHTLVLSAGLLFLPLAIAQGWTPPKGGAQSLWLMALFAVSVGVPFFAISANAPLLQRWFSRTDDKNADDPYFLYAASNAGSLLSLCLYPVMFEPMLRLSEQTALWSQGYCVLIAIILMAGSFAYVRRRPEAPVQMVTKPHSAIAHNTRLMWVFFAFIPSSLMLGVTSFMTNEIVSAPLLWIIPLALYLLTFVFVFAKNPIFTSQRLSILFPWTILAALGATVIFREAPLLSLGGSLATYFVIALMSHARLVEARPETEHLTEFYIWMSVGGVLGGVFNALLAPMIFEGIYEYALILLAAVFIMPGSEKILQLAGAERKTALLYSALAAVLCLALSFSPAPVMLPIILAGTVILLAFMKLNAPTMTLIQVASIVMVFAVAFPKGEAGTIMKDRSFFGVAKVVNWDMEDDGFVHAFYHGSTLHNMQYRDEEKRKIPLAYYTEGGTFHRALSFARQGRPALDVTMIGLGAGAMACHERAGDEWIYIEIDKSVVDMATNSDYFTFMQDCSAKSDIRIGDARLEMKHIADGSQDLIMVDAFSSDVIPAHLVTQEALALYRAKLKEDGLIFFHTSNRLLDVSSVVVSLADDAGLASRYMSYRPDRQAVKNGLYTSFSDAVILGPEEAMARLSGGDADWKSFHASPDVGVWTDDYSHILGTLIAQHRKNGYPDGEKPPAP